MPEPASLLCLHCGYDLRATPAEGNCPECNTPVSESVAFAAIPVRPAWKDSDPRWRRRIVAGLWVLALMPLVPALQYLEIGRQIVVPFRLYGPESGQRLGESFLIHSYDFILFSVGFVLLFARERGRRRARLDWTKRWGVVGCYFVAIAGAATWTLITSLVLVGITALHYSLPPENQPASTEFMASLSTMGVRYFPQTSDFGYALLPMASALVVLLACVPLRDALRSSLPTRRPSAIAVIVLLPLWLTASITVGYLAVMLALSVGALSYDMLPPIYFFESSDLAGGTVGFFNATSQTLLAKWQWLNWLKYLPILLLAMWFTLAQIHAWIDGRRHGKVEASDPSLIPDS